jgi:hypothetical protein
MSVIPVSIDAAALVLMGSVFVGLGGRRRLRLRAAVTAFVGAFGGALAVAASSASQWEGVVSTATLVIGFYAVVEVVALLPDPGSGDDQGGGAGRPPPQPGAPTGGGSGGTEPEWWPQFERDFAAYQRVSND